MNIFPLGIAEAQIKRFKIVFVIDSIIRCVLVGARANFSSMFDVGFFLIFLLAAFFFFIYTLIQIHRTVKILYPAGFFITSPGWSVVLQFLFGHNVFGFILPIFVWVQSEKFQKMTTKN